MSESRSVEHRKAASRAGLNYVTDGVPGISRRRAGKGWIFFKPGGERITDAEERRRINGLVIPPAWTDVWISPDPKGHIQATARDARGRKQYRYHARYRDARDQSKFRHMLEISLQVPFMRTDLKKQRIHAVCLMSGPHGRGVPVIWNCISVLNSD